MTISLTFTNLAESRIHDRSKQNRCQSSSPGLHLQTLRDRQNQGNTSSAGFEEEENFPLHVTSFTLNSVKLAYHQCNNKMIYLKSSMMQKL